MSKRDALPFMIAVVAVFGLLLLSVAVANWCGATTTQTTVHGRCITTTVASIWGTAIHSVTICGR